MNDIASVVGVVACWTFALWATREAVRGIREDRREKRRQAP